jgi:transposase-like protein
MARARRKRKSYTAQQRATILAAAQREQLTAAAVQKKFGVTPVTYYSWRKKSGVGRPRRGRPPGSGRALMAGGGDFSTDVRTVVAHRVRQILPEIVRSEVSNYLNTVFARGGRRRRRSV